MATKYETITASSPETPIVDRSQYEVLRPDGYHTNIESQEQLLEEYLGRVSNLIQKIVGDKNEPGFDTVVFLDKSARPLAWMVRKFWPYMAPQEVDEHTGKPATVPMPDMRFINIDRIPWRNEPKVSFDEGGMKEIQPEDVDGLRSIFQLEPRHNALDGKRVLLVDEQAESGDTLTVAGKLFGRAFPESTIKGTAWMYHPRTNRPQVIRETPMWYPLEKSDTGFQEEFGRGVNNPAAYDPLNPYHEDRVLPGGYQFLSTAPGMKKDEQSLDREGNQLLADLRSRLEGTNDPEERRYINRQIRRLMTNPDEKSNKLREEVNHMLGDFLGGKLFPIITTDRKEILGQDPIAYGRRARDIRTAR